MFLRAVRSILAANKGRCSWPFHSCWLAAATMQDLRSFPTDFDRSAPAPSGRSLLRCGCRNILASAGLHAWTAGAIGQMTARCHDARGARSYRTAAQGLRCHTGDLCLRPHRRAGADHGDVYWLIRASKSRRGCLARGIRRLCHMLCTVAAAAAAGLGRAELT
jgi:hypothetical protein